MSKVSIPTTYTINSNLALSGGLDMDLDNIHIRELPTISLNSDNKLVSESNLTSHNKVDMGLDNIRIKEIPRIDLHVEMAMNPTRVHLPVNLKFGLCAMGIELLALCVCGESMAVIEDYVPHKTEQCV